MQSNYKKEKKCKSCIEIKMTAPLFFLVYEEVKERQRRRNRGRRRRTGEREIQRGHNKNNKN